MSLLRRWMLPAMGAAFAACCLLAAASSEAEAAGLRCGPYPAEAKGPGPGPNRLGVLSRGLNITNLFKPEANLAQLARELRELRRIGVRHVRIPVLPEAVLTDKPYSLARVDAAVCEVLEADLGVIVDMHPWQAFKPQDGKWQDAQDGLARAWERLAARYAGLSPERVFFEALNEPALHDAAVWGGLQHVLLERIRAAAPKHTVILTASPDSTPWALSQTQPEADRNVVYAFHFYTPMIFTHQGAEWSWPSYASIRGLAYPAVAANVAMVSSAADPPFREELQHYAAGAGNPAALATEIGYATDWAKRNGVALVLTEFGVYKQAAPAASRVAWLRSVRTLAAEHGIGWTLWEYEGGFGVREDLLTGCARPTPITEALGLCSP